MSWNPLSYLPVVGSYFTPAAAGEQPGAPAPAGKAAAAAPAPAGASVSTGEEGKKAGCCSRISACFSACRPSACCARLPSCNLYLKDRCGRFWGSIGSGLSSCGSSLKAMSCGLISARTGYIALGVAGAGVLGKVGLDWKGANDLMTTLQDKAVTVVNSNPGLQSTALVTSSFSLSNPTQTGLALSGWMDQAARLSRDIETLRAENELLRAEKGQAVSATEAAKAAATEELKPLLKRDGACSILEKDVLDGLHTQNDELRQNAASLRSSLQACEAREAANKAWLF